MRQALRLAELLCARLCTELGTTLNGFIAAVEIAGEAPGGTVLADQEATALGRRLQLMQATWAGGVGELAASQVHELLLPLQEWRGVDVDLTELDPTVPFHGSAVRLLLNLALLGAEGLPSGGTVTFSGSAVQDVLVEIAGPRAAWPAGLASCLADEQAAWAALKSPRAAQLVLTAMLAHSAGLRLVMVMSGAPLGIPPPLLLTLSQSG